MKALFQHRAALESAAAPWALRGHVVTASAPESVSLMCSEAVARMICQTRGVWEMQPGARLTSARNRETLYRLLAAASTNRSLAAEPNGVIRRLIPLLRHYESVL